MAETCRITSYRLNIPSHTYAQKQQEGEKTDGSDRMEITASVKYVSSPSPSFSVGGWTRFSVLTYRVVKRIGCGIVFGGIIIWNEWQMAAVST